MRHRGLLTTAILIAACCVPQTGRASLGDQYPADSDGNIPIPALSALASSVVGSPVTAYCAPTDANNFGWTWSTGTLNDDGTETITIDPELFISGDICAELVKLTDYPAHHRTFRQKPRANALIWIANAHTYGAANALLALVHEAMHIKLQSDDEGLVECTAVRNLWPTISALRLPGWLNQELLDDAKDVHEKAPDEYLTQC